MLARPLSPFTEIDRRTGAKGAKSDEVRMPLPWQCVKLQWAMHFPS